MKRGKYWNCVQSVDNCYKLGHGEIEEAAVFPVNNTTRLHLS